MNERISIVVIDDHPLFRRGVVQTLAAEPDFVVVAEGATADEALDLVAEHLPDLLFLDIGIPGGGIAAAGRMSVEQPFTRVVMLTASESEDDVLAVFKLGARAYILKGVAGTTLVQIARSVLAGETYITPSLAASVLTEDRSASRDGSSLDSLSPRERQILEMVALGRANKEIAGETHLSEKTVKHYMTNILQKLQVRNRVEAALVSYRDLQRRRNR